MAFVLTRGLCLEIDEEENEISHMTAERDHPSRLTEQRVTHILKNYRGDFQIPIGFTYLLYLEFPT